MTEKRRKIGQLIGCDFHTRYQQIAMLDNVTGELTERRLQHENGEANTFYRNLPKPVRVGIEATGPMHWFERLLSELGHELWIGDSAKIRASEVRKQKTDERDAALILDLLLTNRFPKIWVPRQRNAISGNYSVGWRTRWRTLWNLVFHAISAICTRSRRKTGIGIHQSAVKLLTLAVYS